MPTFDFWTWNTQGNFANPNKLAVIAPPAAPQPPAVAAPRIVCVQEGNTRPAGLVQGTPWYNYSGLSVGAFNERCTNHVLVSGLLPTPAVTDLSQSLAGAVAGGEAGRTAAAIGIGPLVVVSWHSLAGPSNQDTRDLLREIERVLGPLQSGAAPMYSTVVIGGDFNASAIDVQTFANTNGTASRPTPLSFPNRMVISSGRATHYSARTQLPASPPGQPPPPVLGPRTQELDFFLVLRRTPAPPAGIPPVDLTATVAPLPRNPLGQGVSDHDPVHKTLTL